MAGSKYEIRKITIDDLSVAPKYFQTDEADPYVIFRHLNWMMFTIKDDPNPYYFMRNNELDKYRWGGVVRLGDGPLAPQTGCHYYDIAQKDTPVIPYAKVSDNPIIYSTGTKYPFSEQTYTEKYAVLKERDIVDFKCEYWPVGLFSQNLSIFIEYLYQPFSLTGTYEGKPVKGIGQFDRVYGQVNKTEQKYTAMAGYVLSSVYSGIRKDGRREWFYGYKQGTNDNRLAIYWLEGEDTIVTEDVFLETNYYHLPYLPPEDPTCACKDIVWKFADKEIHYTGKWGSRRFNAKPLENKVGYANTFGTWYEGNTAYEYEISHTFNESTTATIENLRNSGFKVFE